ncbi:MAG: Rieske 2Fe-2S domain-containing protein [Chlamydiota bacterium]|nr:Rieske 2Fe-2S domain-containing protein [Chlamydiota bacterium]
MAEKIRIAKVSEIPEDQGLVREYRGETIALFNVQGKVYAIENECPHQGGPLGEGCLDGTVVTCPWHSWQFDLRTGDSVMGAQGVSVFPVAIEGDDVFIVPDK